METWIFSTVSPQERAATPAFRTPRFHRTLSRWVETVVAAGFLVEAMGEPRATEEEAAAEPVVADTRNAPIFLHVRCRNAG